MSSSELTCSGSPPRSALVCGVPSTRAVRDSGPCRPPPWLAGARAVVGYALPREVTAHGPRPMTARI